MNSSCSVCPLFFKMAQTQFRKRPQSPGPNRINWRLRDLEEKIRREENLAAEIRYREEIQWPNT